MNYNANTEGWLVVKGDRLCRKLQSMIELAEKTDETITTKELAELLKHLQSYIARTMHKKTRGIESVVMVAPSSVE